MRYIQDMNEADGTDAIEAAMAARILRLEALLAATVAETAAIDRKLARADRIADRTTARRR